MKESAERPKSGTVREFVDAETGWRVWERYSEVGLEYRYSSPADGGEISGSCVHEVYEGPARTIQKSNDRQRRIEEHGRQLEAKVADAYPGLGDRQAEARDPWLLLKAAFFRYFEGRIRIDGEDLRPGARARLQGGTWVVEYLVSAESGGRYVELYARSRFTNERWERIHSDGTIECLGHGPDLGIAASDGFYEGLKARGLLDS